jgi:hypothetical protein
MVNFGESDLGFWYDGSIQDTKAKASERSRFARFGCEAMSFLPMPKRILPARNAAGCGAV